MQLWSLLEADLRPPPSKSRCSRSQQKNKKWLGRTDLVIFDVFKRLYWRHLPQYLTKGIGVSLQSPQPLCFHAHNARIQLHLLYSVTSSVRFCVIVGVYSLNFGRQGIIKGSEKSLEFPNHALDRVTYESLTNGNYSLFEAYQKLKRERRERDLADRCAFSEVRSPHD